MRRYRSSQTYALSRARGLPTVGSFKGEWHQRWRLPPTAPQLRSLVPIVRDWPKKSAVWLSEYRGARTFGAVEHVFRRLEETVSAQEELSRLSDAYWNARKAEDRAQASRAMEQVGEVVLRVAPPARVTETGNS